MSLRNLALLLATGALVALVGCGEDAGQGSGGPDADLPDITETGDGGDVAETAADLSDAEADADLPVTAETGEGGDLAETGDDGDVAETGEDVPDETGPELPDVEGLVPDTAVYPEGCSALVPGAGDALEWVATISESGCVVLAEGELPRFAQGVVPYEVRAPLWSDGADKQRGIALPSGSRMTFEPSGAWGFPAGSHLLKSFAVGGRLLETRFLAFDGEHWQGAAYRWREDHSDADLVSDSQTEELADQTWFYPGLDACAQCHTRAAGETLGLRTEQMWRESDMFGLGQVNQVAALAELGYFDGPVDPAALGTPLADFTDPAEPLVARARSYLASNCAHCHQPGGSTFNSLDLRSDRTLEQMRACDAEPLGGTYGLGADARILVPGDAATSLLVHRIDLLGDGQMPPLARNVVDEDAVALLTQWIDTLESCSEDP